MVGTWAVDVSSDAATGDSYITLFRAEYGGIVDNGNQPALQAQEKEFEGNKFFQLKLFSSRIEDIIR